MSVSFFCFGGFGGTHFFLLRGAFLFPPPEDAACRGRRLKLESVGGGQPSMGATRDHYTELVVATLWSKKASAGHSAALCPPTPYRALEAYGLYSVRSRTTGLLKLTGFETYGFALGILALRIFRPEQTGPPVSKGNVDPAWSFSEETRAYECL